MTVVVDYGAGNLSSVLKGLAAAGAAPEVVRSPERLTTANAIVVPGVGHFRATASLDAGWRDGIRDAIDRGVPLLGICLGMQWLFESSDEAPEIAGLGIFRGRIVRLDGGVKVPHVGWNAVTRVSPSSLRSSRSDGEPMYFTHSYAAPVVADTTCVTTHGRRFTAIVERGNVAGVQFHPEKSGAAGIALLEAWCRRAL